MFRGELMATCQVVTDTAWAKLKAALYVHDWVAISDERIVAIDEGEVAFQVRAQAATGTKRTVRLHGREFLARFLTHVLPTGF